MFSKFSDQEGIGVIGIIIFLAFVYAAVSFYAYLNPNFDFAKYTPVYFLQNYRDDQRKADLEKIADALDSYYEENRDLPGGVGFCGRILTVLHPDVKNALSPYFSDGIPQDPEYAGTDKDYFYRKVDRNSYILMAVVDHPETSNTYNFEGCHDWPGDGIYNHLLTND